MRASVKPAKPVRRAAVKGSAGKRARPLGRSESAPKTAAQAKPSRPVAGSARKAKPKLDTTDAQDDTALPAARSNRRGELRREALLEAAREVFLEHGYAGAAIEDVVGRTGGSKASLYSYFGSKEGLFGAMVSEGCREFLRNVAIPTDAPAPGALRAELEAFGLRFFRLYTEPQRVRLMRTVIAEAVRFPDFAQQLYREGPLQVRLGLSAFFVRCHAAGLLRAPDAELAAIQFITLVKGHVQFRSLFGLPALGLAVTPQRFVAEAVRLFLDGRGAVPPPRRNRS